MDELIKKKTNGAIVRSRCAWELAGERPSKYFLNLEKKRAIGRTLQRLITEDGKLVTEGKQVLAEIKKFYAKLYTSKGEIDESYLAKLDIPQLPEEIKMGLENEITVEELGKALFEMPNNKSPGTDGLPAEFYKIFWLKIKHLYHCVIVEAMQNKELHLTARRGIISLLEKRNQDPLRLKCWRPPSLLNLDNKIYSKTLARRLQSVQHKLIHYSQTGFVKGRHLAENIVKIMEIMQQCEDSNIDGLLISFDFMKAFDTVEYRTIFLTMEKFNFGTNFIEMTKVLYNKPLACAYNNGFWSEFFEPTRGTRQGCCYSPIVFTLVVEILGLAIRQNENIKGIKVGEEEIKSGQFADDLWASLLASERNTNAILQELEDFSKFSGLQINSDKSAVLRIGLWKNSNARFYTMRRLFWSPNPIKILGFYIYPDWPRMHVENYDKMLNKIDDIINSWSHRSLTPIGKITVVNSLINSLIVHKLMALPSPNKDFFLTYKRKIVSFIWNDKVPKMAYEKLIQDYSKMGLRLVDLEYKDLALKASWPARWNHRENELTWVYNALPVKDVRIWECNIESKDVETFRKDCTLSSVLAIWKAWSKYHFKNTFDNPIDILDSLFIGNSLIHRQGKPIFNHRLCTSNIDKIIDIYNIEERRFMNLLEIETAFGITNMDLEYLGVIAAIPKFWKVLLRNFDFDEMIDKNSAVEELCLKKESLSRHIYWQLIEQNTTVKTAHKLILQTELNITIEDEEWHMLFPSFRKMIKSTKLQYFQLRVLTGTLTTNVKIHAWNTQKSNLCTFCKQRPETVMHILVTCEKIKMLWICLKKITKYFMSIDVDFSPQMIILNNYTGQRKDLINTMVAIMKQHIYAKKCFEEVPTFTSFMEKLSSWYLVEKQLFMNEHMDMKKLKKKWGNIM